MSMDLRNIKSATVINITGTYPTLAAARTAMQDSVQGEEINFFPDGSGFFFNAIGYGYTDMFVVTAGVVYRVRLIPGNA